MALKLVQALCAQPAAPRWLPAFVKVAAIGTLADVVPLVGENRDHRQARARHAVRRVRTRSACASLLDVCGLTGKEIDSYHIGFVLAPRVNAAGRMSTPDIAARLLLASDEAMADEARELAEQLNTENLRRQQEEAEIVAQAKKIVETDLEVGSRTVIVVAGDGLAPRRHRHRRVEARRRLPPAGDRAVDRRRHRPRVVPQHPVVQHARRRSSRAPT